MTIIRWFANIQEVCGNGEYIPWQIGQYLWLCLKEESPVQAWYHMLTPEWKEWMKNHYLNFLYVVRTYYLGDRWQQDRSTKYLLQRFCQEGYTRETLLEFIQ